MNPKVAPDLFKSWISVVFLAGFVLLLLFLLAPIQVSTTSLNPSTPIRWMAFILGLIFMGVALYAGVREIEGRASTLDRAGRVADETGKARPARKAETRVPQPQPVPTQRSSAPTNIITPAVHTTLPPPQEPLESLQDRVRSLFLSYRSLSQPQIVTGLGFSMLDRSAVDRAQQAVGALFRSQEIEEHPLVFGQLRLRKRD